MYTSPLAGSIVVCKRSIVISAVTQQVKDTFIYKEVWRAVVGQRTVQRIVRLLSRLLVC